MKANHPIAVCVVLFAGLLGVPHTLGNPSQEERDLSGRYQVEYDDVFLEGYRTQLFEVTTTYHELAFLMDSDHLAATAELATWHVESLQREDLSLLASGGVDFSYLIEALREARDVMTSGKVTGTNAPGPFEPGQVSTGDKGGLPPAPYSEQCGSERTSTGGARAAAIVADAADIVLSVSNRLCDLTVVAAGFGGNAAPLCLVLDIVATAAKVTINQFFGGFCDPDIDSAEIEGAYERAEYISGQIDTLSLDLTGSSNLDERKRIENILAQGNVEVSLALPADFGGQLEDVFTLVDELIAQSAAAGLYVGGAESKYATAEEYLAQGRYGKAYNKLREAYGKLRAAL